MLRRASLALFLLALGLVMACGRQVTPNPTFSNLTGSLEIKFRTVGVPNFQQYNYFMAFNTNGNGQEPYASGFQNGQYANFSYALVTGTISANAVLPILLQYYIVPPQSVRTQLFNLNPATTQLQVGTQTTSQFNEFIVIFARSQLNLPSPVQTSGPSPTPGKPTPTPTPTATGATPVPTGPTPVPTGVRWCVNLFTTNSTGNVVYDAMGTGYQDHSFNRGCFNTNQSTDIVVNQYPEVTPPQDPAAQLYGFELINTP